VSEGVQKEIFSWLKAIVFAVVFVLICQKLIFSPTIVMGESMSPTFEDGNRIIVSKVSDIERFDMVVFDAPDSNEKYIKRVIGLPGDQIEMKDDELLINGVVVPEPYLAEKKKALLVNKLTGDFSLEELTGQQQVPPGYLFVMGDNRLFSKDSRYFGFVSDDAMFGKVIFRYYPFKEIGLLK